MKQEIKEMEALIKGAKEDLRALKAANSNTRQRLLDIVWISFFVVFWVVFYVIALIGVMTLIGIVTK